MNDPDGDFFDGMIIETGEATPLTPHNQALILAGRELISESLSVGREFCKSMISISTGAIPIYLGILAFILPESYMLGISRGALIVLPVLLFLTAAAVFTYGYFPLTDSFSLDVIEEIEAVRGRVISRRTAAARWGFGLFLAASLLAALMLVANIGAR